MRQYQCGYFHWVDPQRSQQDELVAISQSRSLPAGYVFRAKQIFNAG
jgi:hypothetical protein